MDYLRVAEARDRPGLRLVLTAGGPGPWSEAAKAVFHVRRVPFAPVRQETGEPNEELVAWCGHRNAPVAVYEDERPRAAWSEILLLAERLGKGPPLLPADPEQRALVFGLGFEICGEEGLGWCQRLRLQHRQLEERAAAGKGPGRMGYMARLYGYSPEAARRAGPRVASLLRWLASRLKKQREAGSDYFVGETLTAADLYWACFAAMFAPLPDALCPMHPSLREMYTAREPWLVEALDPILLTHRDFIYRKHLPLPLDF